jgi:hypothetical protein
VIALVGIQTALLTRGNTLLPRMRRRTAVPQPASPRPD